MRGEFIGVWSETHRQIWAELAAHEAAPANLFCELFRELGGALKVPLKAQELAEVLVDNNRSRAHFEAITAEDLKGEQSVVKFLEGVHDVLEEAGGDPISNPYFLLLSGFIEKFSLRYDLRRPCILCPTLPGVFASLFRDLRALTSQDQHLNQLMKEYEDALRDLRFGSTDGRIKTCIGKQFMLLEAVSALDPTVTKNTLGDMCDQVKSWPHTTIKDSLKKLYGFASDYPGIRHGSRAKGSLRAIDMRDLVALSILLTGFTPYLERRLSADAIYGGGVNTTPSSQPVAVVASDAVGGKSHARGLFRQLLDRLLRAKP